MRKVRAAQLDGSGLLHTTHTWKDVSLRNLGLRLNRVLIEDLVRGELL